MTCALFRGIVRARSRDSVRHVCAQLYVAQAALCLYAVLMLGRRGAETHTQFTALILLKRFCVSTWMVKTKQRGVELLQQVNYNVLFPIFVSRSA